LIQLPLLWIMLRIRIDAMLRSSTWIKLLFFILAITFFVFGGYLSNKNTLSEWLVSSLVYLIGLHWVYAYIWKKDMHNHLGKVCYDPEGKHHKVRFLSFVFGLCVCIYIIFI
jgi:hypothetical protein